MVGIDYKNFAQKLTMKLTNEFSVVKVGDRNLAPSPTPKVQDRQSGISKR